MKSKKYKTKPFLISFVMSFAFLLTILIPTLTIVLINNISSNSTHQNVKNINKNQDAEKIMRSRSLSLFFAKKSGNFSYDGVYGTAWVLPNGIKNVTNSSLNCYIATNVHVISDFVNISHSISNNEYNYSYTLNNNFDVLFLKYFSGQDYNHLIGNSLTERQFIEKNNIQVKKMFINNNPNYDNLYPYPYDLTTKNVKNRMSEISILELNITNENEQLFNWALRIKDLDERPEGFFSNIPRLEFLNTAINEYETSPWEQIDSIYVGGFPHITQDVNWMSFSFDQSSGIEYEFRTNYSFETKNFALPYKGIKLNINNKITYFKNISLQFIIPTLNIGKGSSGSMLIVKLKNNPVYYIVGIWWGVYEINHLNNCEIKGAADIFITDNSYFIDKGTTQIKWPAYNYVEEINQIDSQDENIK